MNFDEILITLGEFGNYQKFIYFLLCIPSIFGGFFMTISVFLLGEPKHRCQLPNYENDTYEPQGLYHQNLIQKYIPPPSDDTKDYDDCYIYSFNYSVTSFDNMSYPINASKRMCTSWVYDQSIFKSTFTSKLDMVCDETYKQTLAKMMFFAGVLVGAFVLGVLSDSIGRKKTLHLSFAMIIAASVGLAFAPNYITFVVLRFIIGAALAGVGMTTFVIGIELVGPSKRKLAGIIIQYFFSLGLVLLSGVAYLIRDWKFIEIAVSAPCVLFLFYWLVVPEPPRWLLSQGKLEEADKIIKKAAYYNKVTLPDKLFEEELTRPADTGRIWHLFTSRVLFVRTIIIFVNWMVVSMTYYGLSLNTGNLAGDFYANFLISGLVEFPAQTITLFLLDRIGRKKLHCLSMVLGGTACLSTILTIVFGGKSLQPLTTTLAMIGKAGATSAFDVIYIYSAELYPTVVRNAGMGASSCCARIGGIVAPLVADSAKRVGGDIGQTIPLMIFGGASVVTGLLSLLLPETLGHSLPETIEDGIIYETNNYEKRKTIEKMVLQTTESDIATISNNVFDTKM